MKMFRELIKKNCEIEFGRGTLKKMGLNGTFIV